MFGSLEGNCEGAGFSLVVSVFGLWLCLKVILYHCTVLNNFIDSDKSVINTKTNICFVLLFSDTKNASIFRTKRGKNNQTDLSKGNQYKKKITGTLYLKKNDMSSLK